MTIDRMIHIRDIFSVYFEPDIDSVCVTFFKEDITFRLNDFSLADSLVLNTIELKKSIEDAIYRAYLQGQSIDLSSFDTFEDIARRNNAEIADIWPDDNGIAGYNVYLSETDVSLGFVEVVYSGFDDPIVMEIKFERGRRVQPLLEEIVELLNYVIGK